MLYTYSYNYGHIHHKNYYKFVLNIFFIKIWMDMRWYLLTFYKKCMFLGFEFNKQDYSVLKAQASTIFMLNNIKPGFYVLATICYSNYKYGYLWDTIFVSYFQFMILVLPIPARMERPVQALMEIISVLASLDIVDLLVQQVSFL